jgi:hypothetical protein
MALLVVNVQMDITKTTLMCAKYAINSAKHAKMATQGTNVSNVRTDYTYKQNQVPV